ncbi:MAG: BREX system P-loop protein BrxC [Caldilineaceae bacterium]|nr:BREX system P-loop protein BrxC [Caldilineaceae bacterium]
MMMSSIFRKPIDRPIEGVIKADDEAALYTEVEEYVLTDEVIRRLEEFLGAYLHYAGANGVWISGFFGSGKSHLLKMLAFLLENRTVDGVRVLDLFLPKCGQNELLKADLKRAVAIPAKSILFNIDQKADVISKQQIDALLAVFVKVFDEMCGYYGKQGYIAQFERDLDSRGQLAAFRSAYESVAGRTWERGREQALLEARNVAAAYAQVTGETAAAGAGILDKYRSQYKMSIEDFAEQVNAYIERQGPEFRLNFCVDEVGQYIADSVKLMTNLQTIAESLATKCRGRAWVIVTAQEDMSDILGEMSQQQGTDFTKIQARFQTRMKLTSANVAEVIRSRLLDKNAGGIDRLTDVYEREQNNFRTLFDFADGAQLYRNFRDRDEFVRTYPFVTYQFTLFQLAIRNLSLHDAFEGRHRSVGERSMLAVFQQVVIQVGEHKIGELATFDLMFEGIRTALKTQIQSAIQTAEQNLDNPLAVQVLKALFLVKYVRGFKATLHNLTVLMLPRFDVDLLALQRRLEEALNLLEQQTYIQRNGDVFEYLTNEEKDVEQEIKNTEISTDALVEEMERLIFDGIVKERKIRYADGAQDYPFARKIDDRLMGRQQELAIHVITPFHEHAENPAVLRAQAMGRDEVLLLLPPNDRFMRELLMYKRTDKYVRQNLASAQQSSVQRILNERQVQNVNRQAILRTLMAEMLSQATVVVNGQELDLTSKDAPTRVVQGFQELITRTYPNLRMLRGVTYREEEIARYLQPSPTLYGDDSANYSEAEQELLAHIQTNSRSGLRTTLQALVTRFERKPYGWYLAAIQCTLAKLCARGKVEVRLDGNLLEGQTLEHALRNTRGFDNVLLEPQIDFTPAQVRQLKDFHSDFFNDPPLANEAKALGRETAAAMQKLGQDLAALRAQAGDYPFLTVLDAPLAQIQAVTGRQYDFYLTELARQTDALLDAKEQVLDPVRHFMNGAQKEIYANARRYLAAQEANFPHVAGDEDRQLQALLDDPQCYAGNRMTQAKSLLDGLQAKVAAVVQAEQQSALAKVEERWERLTGMAEFGDLTPVQQAELRRPFDELQRMLRRQTLVAVIRDTVQRFDLDDYGRQLALMTAWSAQARRPAPDDGDERKVIEPTPEYVLQRTLAIPFDKPWLADEGDVDAYLAALKAAMMAVIEAGKRVQV